MGNSTRPPVNPGAESSRSLADLLELVAQSDITAFGELYSRISWKVFGLATALIRDTGHAEEVTQEVFLEIWQRAAGFDRNRGSASGFIMRLAHSRSVDRIRHTNNCRLRDSAYIRQETRGDVDVVIDDVFRQDDARQLHAAVSGLSSLQREAITLTFLAGHTNRVASEMLDIPLSTLKTRVRDGVRALRCASPSLVT